jgi:hypothetical protein
MTLSFISGVLAAVLFLIAILITVFGIIRKIATKSVPQKSIQRIEVVNCFVCGRPMEQGFVNVLGNVRWREFDSPPPKTSKYGELLKNLSADQMSQIMTFGLQEHTALRCKDCSVLTIDHSKLLKIK